MVLAKEVGNVVCVGCGFSASSLFCLLESALLPSFATLA